MVRRLKYPANRDPQTNLDFKQRNGESARAYASRVRYIWDQWNRNRVAANLERVDPPAGLNINTTFRPPVNSDGNRPDNASVSYTAWRNRNRNAGPLVDAFNRTPAIDPNNPHRAYNDPELNALIESGTLNNLAGGSVPGRINSPDTLDRLISEADAAEAGPSRKRPRIDSSSEAGGSSDEMPANTRSQAGGGMEVDPPAAGAAATSGPTGKNAGADGGFDSAQGPESLIKKGGYQHGGGYKKFDKVHHLKSFALPFYNVNFGTDIKYTVTPLAEIPWDKMFFYMSEDEFNLIPAGSHVVSCKIEIMNIVSSTQHPVGGTVASIATFNHPKIGVLGFDLEKTSRGGRSMEVNMSSTAEMIPTGVENPDYSDFILKAYGTDQSSASWDADDLPGTMFPIPYNLYKYFCVYQPTKTKAVTDGFTAQNAPGYENFSSCITQFNLNDRTWDDVFSREYSFTSAPIGQPFQAVELNSDEVVTAVGGSNYYNMVRTIKDFGVKGDATITETISPSSAAKVPLVSYTGRIEQGANISLGDAARKPARQPTVHFGMRAIPKLSSLTNDTRASKFVHAEVYFIVRASMVIKTNSFPNRFIKPKANTVSIENFVGGTGRQALDVNLPENVTFGLSNSTVYPVPVPP